ncbi:hypothetical protein J4573_26000 [Actinomadura barringtoniae]|uniref:Transmembrane protein n=1 Tax=Actinomadura barringtoniae TaxID=1427535 RepID=A0A939PE04_9ACTN|nr:hypothetical protein [Actinomadura barringtoniae]MBO2450583.1 hypothetical protein [Actinomadura barringtoniae]
MDPDHDARASLEEIRRRQGQTREAAARRRLSTPYVLATGAALFVFVLGTDAEGVAGVAICAVAMAAFGLLMWRGLGRAPVRLRRRNWSRREWVFFAAGTFAVWALIAVIGLIVGLVYLPAQTATLAVVATGAYVVLTLVGQRVSASAVRSGARG